MALLLLIVAASLISGCWSQAEVPQDRKSDVSSVPILRQINHVGNDGSYTYGYESADGSFKAEYKDALGNVQGKYGYVDENGQLKVVSYTVNKNEGFKIISDTSLRMSQKSDISTHIKSVTPEDKLAESPLLTNPDVVSPNDLFIDNGEVGTPEPVLKSNSLSDILLPPKINVGNQLTQPKDNKLVNIPSKQEHQEFIPTTDTKINQQTTDVLPAGTFSLTNPLDVSSFFKNELKFRNIDIDRDSRHDGSFVPHPQAHAQLTPEHKSDNSIFISDSTSSTAQDNVNTAHTINNNAHKLDANINKNTETSQSAIAPGVPPVSKAPQNPVKLILLPQNQLHQMINQPQQNPGFPLIGFIVPNTGPLQSAATQFLQNQVPRQQGFLPARSSIPNQQTRFQPNQLTLNRPQLVPQQRLPHFESQRIPNINNRPVFLKPQLNNQIQPQLNNQIQPQLNNQIQPQQNNQIQPPRQFIFRQQPIFQPHRFQGHQQQPLQQAGHLVLVPRQDSTPLPDSSKDKV